MKAALEAAMKAAVANGTYAALIEKWKLPASVACSDLLARGARNAARPATSWARSTSSSAIWSRRSSSRGAAMTLAITVLSVLFGMVVGLCVALLQESGHGRCGASPCLSVAVPRHAGAVPDHLHLQRAAVLRHRAVRLRLRRPGAVPERGRLHGGNHALRPAGGRERPAHGRAGARHDAAGR